MRLRESCPTPHHPMRANLPTVICTTTSMSKNTFQKSLPKTPFIILFPLRENKRRGNFPSAPNIRDLQHRIATYTQNATDAIRIQPGNLWTVISNFLLHLIIPSDIRPTATAFNFILKFCLCRQIRHQFRGEQSFTFRHDGILHLRLVYLRTEKYADCLFIGWLPL